MDRNSGYGDRRPVGRKTLECDLTERPAVHCVRVIHRQLFEVEVIDAASDLLVRGEADADLAVRQFGMRQQCFRKRHDDSDASFVIGPKQSCAASRNDVFADLLLEIGICIRRKHLGWSSGSTIGEPS